MIDSGYCCPDFTYLGFLPFPVTTNTGELYNISGFSGPISQETPTFSGLVGPGTYYPFSGNIDRINRMFWCVKEWNLSMSLYRRGFTETVTCTDAFGFNPFGGLPPITVFTFCEVGNNGLPGSFDNRVLTTQDYCSSQSFPTGFNQDINGVCPYAEYSGSNPNTSICVPINPIQHFSDLMCRQSYFSWVPKSGEIKLFQSGSFSKVNTHPYFSDVPYSRRISVPFLDPLYDCGNLHPGTSSALSYFSLSIMDADVLIHSGSIHRRITGYIPEVEESAPPFSCFGPSGSVLTSEFGDITGYGVLPKPSGINIPLLFDAGTGYNLLPISGTSNTYFPFFHFYCTVRSNPVDSILNCSFLDKFSTIPSVPNQRNGGRIRILDVTGMTQPIEIPLYAESVANSVYLDVSLSPGELWITSSGTPNF